MVNQLMVVLMAVFQEMAVTPVVTQLMEVVMAVFQAMAAARVEVTVA